VPNLGTMVCTALMCGLLASCDRAEPDGAWQSRAADETGQVDPARLVQESGLGAVNGRAAERWFSRVLLEAGQIVDGTAMFAAATYLYVRDGGSIIVPVAPIELW